MGEIADMMLDGTLDEETGEYIGDYNLKKYGFESPGFPVSLERDIREEHQIIKKKVACPQCGKKVKEVGLGQHIKDVHN